MSGPTWEHVAGNPTTERLKIEGGHLYRILPLSAPVFVPELGYPFGAWLEPIVEALEERNRVRAP